MFRVAHSFSLNRQKYFSMPFSFPSKSFQCILDRTNTIASALLFYRWHLDKAGGRHILTRVLLSSSLCAAKASLCGWEWPLDEKPIRLGQKQLQLGAEGTETICGWCWVALPERHLKSLYAPARLYPDGYLLITLWATVPLMNETTEVGYLVLNVCSPWMEQTQKESALLINLL